MDRRLGVGMRCVKYLLFLLNFVFLVVSVFTIAVGAGILINYYNFELFLISHHFKPAILVITIGALTLLISVIGCTGAIKESTLLVNVYALFIFLLLLLEVGLAITALVMRTYIYDSVEINMETTLHKYKTDSYSKHSWDTTQEILQCCGILQPSDWANLHIDGPTVTNGHFHFTVPYSCCSSKPCNIKYKRGCLKLLSNYVTDSTTVFLYIGVANVIIKLFALIFAIKLARAIRRIKTETEMQRQAVWHRNYERAWSTDDIQNNDAHVNLRY